jgi:hypothetical protein
MLVHPEHMVVGIIGQLGGIALHELAGTSLSGTVGLGAIRAPEFLPDAFNGALFEAQWAYWVVLAAAAGILWGVGRNRADRRMMRIGEIAAGVLLVWMVAAYSVDTPRERLYRAHTGLAEAAKRGDVDGILNYLSPDFHSWALGVEQTAQARDEIGARLKSDGVKGSTITEYHSDLSGRAAFTTLTLITDTDIAGPVKSTWHLSWDDVAGADWRVRDAELVKLGDEAVGGERVLPR